MNASARDQVFGVEGAPQGDSGAEGGIVSGCPLCPACSRSRAHKFNLSESARLCYETALRSQVTRVVFAGTDENG